MTEAVYQYLLGAALQDQGVVTLTGRRAGRSAVHTTGFGIFDYPVAFHNRILAGAKED
jgi:hypothetical protein